MNSKCIWFYIGTSILLFVSSANGNFCFVQPTRAYFDSAKEVFVGTVTEVVKVGDAYPTKQSFVVKEAPIEIRIKAEEVLKGSSGVGRVISLYYRSSWDTNVGLFVLGTRYLVFAREVEFDKEGMVEKTFHFLRARRLLTTTDCVGTVNDRSPDFRGRLQRVKKFAEEIRSAKSKKE